MTATEMLKQFEDEINQSNNFSVKTSLVGSLLTRASKELYSELYYNRVKNPPDPKAPVPYSFESEEYTARAMQPFKKVVSTTTDVLGFIQNHTLMAHITAVSAIKNDNPNCINPDYASVGYVSDNELTARQNDRLRQPTWNEADIPVYARYMPVYHLETNKVGQLGFRMYPNRKYTIKIDYVKFPNDIKIKSQQWEIDKYTGNPQFVLQGTDINSEFPDFLHNEIVKRAVALFALENPDPQQFQIETSKIMSGQI